MFCESPGSLTFEIQDVPAIAAWRMRAAPPCCSTTPGATPLFFPGAVAHGVDLSIQAATKYIGGHADVMIGYVSANETHAARLVDT